MDNRLQNGNEVAPEHESCADGPGRCSGRREFLVRTTSTAGGLMLGLAGLGALTSPARADDDDQEEGRGKAAPVVDATAQPADDVVLTLDAKSPLHEVGGSAVVQTKAGKVIIARTGEATFAACSAVCTHRGGTVDYDATNKQFHCPRHGARFATDGTVQRGPARQPLKSYTTETAAVINLKGA